MKNWILYATPKADKSVIGLFNESNLPGVFIPVPASAGSHPELVSGEVRIIGSKAIRDFLNQYRDC